MFPSIVACLVCSLLFIQVIQLVKSCTCFFLIRIHPSYLICNRLRFNVYNDQERVSLCVLSRYQLTRVIIVIYFPLLYLKQPGTNLATTNFLSVFYLISFFLLELARGKVTSPKLIVYNLKRHRIALSESPVFLLP